MEGLYYPYSENKGADQLRGYRKADLRLCFRICKKPVFPRRGSNCKPHVSLSSCRVWFVSCILGSPESMSSRERRLIQKFEPRHKKTFLFAYVKKSQITCTVTKQLISAYVFC